MRAGAILSAAAMGFFVSQTAAIRSAAAMSACPSWTSNGSFAGQMARYNASNGDPSRLPPIDADAAADMQQEIQQFARDNFQNDGKVEGYEGELVAQRLRSRLATRVPRYSKDIEDMGRQELVDCIPGAAAVFAATDKLQREDQQAQETSEHPDATLLTAYHDYIGVRACQKARAGYEQIYVSDDEVEAAKDIVKAIEDTIRQRSPSIDKDKIWEDADGLELGELVDKSQIAWMNKNAQQYVVGMRLFGASAVQNGQFNEYGRAFCSSLLQSLRATAKGLNIAMTHKKDF